MSDLSHMRKVTLYHWLGSVNLEVGDAPHELCNGKIKPHMRPWGDKHGKPERWECFSIGANEVVSAFSATKERAFLRWKCLYTRNNVYPPLS